MGIAISTASAARVFAAQLAKSDHPADAKRFADSKTLDHFAGRSRSRLHDCGLRSAHEQVSCLGHATVMAKSGTPRTGLEVRNAVLECIRLLCMASSVVSQDRA